jgi:hypothetical protein
VSARLSDAQRRALALIADGQVYYKPIFGRVFGIRAGTLEALERRGLAEIADQPENPDARGIGQRHRVRLTAAGREAVS